MARAAKFHMALFESDNINSEVGRWDRASTITASLAVAGYELRLVRKVTGGVRGINICPY